ncbi:hypothetical protein GCM10009824_06070 [Kocuria atrinae]|uniref:Uncharacterized protein n=1 Tax=Kocuria atrinae TaxID=592377 RepID=A0ABP5J568_9MICC
MGQDQVIPPDCTVGGSTVQSGGTQWRRSVLRARKPGPAASALAKVAEVAEVAEDYRTATDQMSSMVTKKPVR